MKNITFSAKDEVIDGLRRVAASKNMTPNDLFREWAEKYVAKQEAVEREKRLKAFDESVKKFSFVSDRKYTREEMNER